MMAVGVPEIETQRELLEVGAGKGCRGTSKFQCEGFELVVSLGLSKSRTPHYFTHILTCFLSLYHEPDLNLITHEHAI